MQPFPPSVVPLLITRSIVNQRANGSLPLADGSGSVGDPASEYRFSSLLFPAAALTRVLLRWIGLGHAVLLRNWTRRDLADTRFSTAAGEQLGYLLGFAPRADSGAISHRDDQVQLWCVACPCPKYFLPTLSPRACVSRADFVYMAPPFIAYFGALQNDDGGLALLQIAYDQIRLYRDALFDADVSLWRHVTLGSWEDSGHWATGAQTVLSSRELLRKSRCSRFRRRKWLGCRRRDACPGHDQTLSLCIGDAVTTRRSRAVG